MKRFLSLFFVFFSVVLYAQAQDSTFQEMDTVIVNENDVLIFEDSTVYIQQDTIISIPDSIDYIIRLNDSIKTQRFYDSLKVKLYKSQLTKEIYDLLFTSSASNEPEEVVEETGENSESPYLPYKGKIIGDISVHRLDPFGTNVEDTSVHADVWMVKTGNRFHIKTHERVIRKSLLIEKGDPINPYQLADNERLLRELPYLRDARINIVPRVNDKDTVDVFIVTKDVWSITFDVNARGFISGSLDIEDRNILGLGHELDNRIVVSPDEAKNWGYEGTYRIPNISGTFITGEITYANVYDREGYALNIYRDFITPATKYAGGINIGNLRSIEDRRFEDDSIIFNYPLKFNYQDIWFGRSFRVRKNRQVSERSNIVLAGRVARTNYAERPIVESDSNRNYHNTTLALASIGYSTRIYYEAQFINSFGRTEDIPAGSSVELTAGKEYGEFNNRFYSGLRLAKGIYSKENGYFSGEIDFGGFFRSSRFEQGVLRLNGSYFSNLLHIKRYAIRQFIRANYTLGMRRFANETVDFNDDNGITGLDSDLLRGTRKLVVNLETVLFTPFNPVGFKIALFGFADFGMLSREKSVFTGDFYSGFGMGVRIRNDNLTFNTFQIRLGFYPIVPHNESYFSFNVSGEAVLGLKDYDIKAPDVLRLY